MLTEIPEPEGVVLKFHCTLFFIFLNCLFILKVKNFLIYLYRRCSYILETETQIKSRAALMLVVYISVF